MAITVTIVGDVCTINFVTSVVGCHANAVCLARDVLFHLV